MYFEAPGSLPRSQPRLAFRLVLALNAVVVVGFGLLPESLLQLCRAVIPGG